jgi:beta-galactosidase GanA
MKCRTYLYAALVGQLSLLATQGQSGSVSAASASDIPHLRKQGTATQLIVDGKAFLALAGELSNSSATGVDYMKRVWPKLVAQKGLNTVLAGVSWNQVEPQEGKFDFTVLDSVIEGARQNNIRVVLLWFGSWKNGTSSYPPDWVKKDFERFPRAQPTEGRSIEQLSCFSEANRDADARAFAALMRHVKQVDGRRHTVIMIQVENEINGLDHSPLANKAREDRVPAELMDYLQSHKDTLTPEVRQVWEAAGFKTAGTWDEVFGKSGGADEIFIAWHYAKYAGRVAEAGKAEYPIPMYANTWGEGFPRGNARANGAPKPSVIDVWRAGAPKIDMLSPDIYYSDFKAFCAQYTQSGNPLFIPETRYEMDSRLLYALGRHDAIGVSLMGVERAVTPDPQLITGCEMITQLAPLIAKHQGDGSMSAVLLTTNDPPQKVQVGNYTMQVTRLRSRSSAPVQTAYAAALFIAVGPDEYYAVGDGVSVTISPSATGLSHVGIGTVEEGTFVNGRWIPSRQLAGDETGQGANLSLRSHPVDRIPGDGYVGIQHFTLYRYP